MSARHTARKPTGVLYGFGDGPDVEYDTLQCVHCGGCWVVEPGSGKERGWCMNCHGPHCGRPNCWTCKPVEKMLEEIERRHSRMARLGV